MLGKYIGCSSEVLVGSSMLNTSEVNLMSNLFFLLPRKLFVLLLCRVTNESFRTSEAVKFTDWIWWVKLLCPSVPKRCPDLTYKVKVINDSWYFLSQNVVNLCIWRVANQTDKVNFVMHVVKYYKLYFFWQKTFFISSWILQEVYEEILFGNMKVYLKLGFSHMPWYKILFYSLVLLDIKFTVLDFS